MKTHALSLDEKFSNDLYAELTEKEMKMKTLNLHESINVWKESFESLSISDHERENAKNDFFLIEGACIVQNVFSEIQKMMIIDVQESLPAESDRIQMIIELIERARSIAELTRLMSRVFRSQSHAATLVRMRESVQYILACRGIHVS